MLGGHLLGNRSASLSLCLGIRHICFLLFLRPTTLGISSLFWRWTHRCTGLIHLGFWERSGVLRRGTLLGTGPSRGEARHHPALSPQHAPTLSFTQALVGWRRYSGNAFGISVSIFSFQKVNFFGNLMKMMYTWTLASFRGVHGPSAVHPWTWVRTLLS